MFNFYIVLQRENRSFSLGLVMLSDNLFTLNHKDNLLNSSIVISIKCRIFLKYVGVICKRCVIIGEAEPMSLISVKNRNRSETES